MKDLYGFVFLHFIKNIAPSEQIHRPKKNLDCLELYERHGPKIHGQL